MAKNFKPNKGKGKRGNKPHTNKPAMNKQGEFTDDSFREASQPGNKGNDTSYYSHNPELLNIAGKYSFASALGMYTPFGTDVNSTVNSAFDSHLYRILNEQTTSTPLPLWASVLDVPGIMTLELSLVPGFSSGTTSAVNIAARNLYTATRKEQTGQFVFDAVDEMMFAITMDNLNCFYVWMQRLYGIMNNYQVLNRYVPDALIRANHVDPVDLRKHKADLLYYMEQFAVYVRAYPIPTEMSYFKRHAEMFANVYKDGEGDKAQLYCFVPAGFWAFNETFSTADKGSLSYQPLTVQTGSTIFKLLSFDEITALGDRLLTGVISSQDAGNISAAMLKAFGYDSYAFGSTDWTYKVEPVYNEEILMQIHNAKAVGYFSSNSDITQNDEGQLIFAPILNQSLNQQVIIDCAYNDPTPDEVFAMTRFAAIVTSQDSSKSTGVAGAEIVNMIHMFKFAHSDPSEAEEPILGWAQIPTYRKISNNASVPPDFILFLEMFTDVSKFDWSPVIDMLVAQQGSGGIVTSALRLPFNDFENYVVMGVEDLRKLHEVALLSLFGVPRKE